MPRRYSSVSRSNSRSRSPERRENARRKDRDHSGRSRSRSASPSRSKRKDGSSRKERIKDDRKLPYDAQPISSDDYFLKSDEFRLWLREDKEKYFDELSGERARSYFRKFVKAWNKGKLSSKFYKGIDASAVSASSQTAYKWSFRNKIPESEARFTRKDVAADTAASTSNVGRGRVSGPTLPSAADITLARENEAEEAEKERKYKRKRERAEERDRLEDVIGPKEVGKEGMLEKKRAKRENDKAFREGGDDGLAMDEGTLMGGGDSFKDQVARREAHKRKYELQREEQAAASRERKAQMKERDDKNMAMFQALAKQRFG